MNKIIELLNKLNIKTKRLGLYIEAMTHNSYNYERKTLANYQRLEFLGDAIVSKIVSCYLYFLDFDEKEMTEKRKILIKSETFLMASEELNLINYAFLGKGINLEKDTTKIKEDIFESLLGAIYLDQGEFKVYEILQKTIFKYFENNLIRDPIDYKTKMQELFQSKEFNQTKNVVINYDCKNINKNFVCTLSANGKVYGVGEGKTKKEAERNAAKIAYLKHHNPSVENIDK